MSPRAVAPTDLHADVRLLAMRAAETARAAGASWCPCCRCGGWDGPDEGHWTRAARVLGRPLSVAEGRVFVRVFRVMLMLYPHELCEAHQSQRASA